MKHPKKPEPSFIDQVNDTLIFRGESPLTACEALRVRTGLSWMTEPSDAVAIVVDERGKVIWDYHGQLELPCVNNNWARL